MHKWWWSCNIDWMKQQSFYSHSHTDSHSQPESIYLGDSSKSSQSRQYMSLFLEQEQDSRITQALIRGVRAAFRLSNPNWLSRKTRNNYSGVSYCYNFITSQSPFNYIISLLSVPGITRNKNSHLKRAEGS